MSDKKVVLIRETPYKIRKNKISVNLMTLLWEFLYEHGYITWQEYTEQVPVGQRPRKHKKPRR